MSIPREKDMTSEESRGPGEPHVWAVLDTVPGLLSPLRPSFKCSTAFPLQLSSVRAEGVGLLSKLWNPTRLGGEAWEASKLCVNNWKVGGLWTIGKFEAWHCMRERLTILWTGCDGLWRLAFAGNVDCLPISNQSVRWDGHWPREWRNCSNPTLLIDWFNNKNLLK